MQIEVRALTESEVNRLVSEASEKEVRNLSSNPYEFFNRHAVESSGIVIDGKPIYMAYLVRNNMVYELWTVVNRNVKEQFTLFKEAKRKLRDWYDRYSPILSTMENIKENELNIKWTKRLGFKEVKSDSHIITMVLEV